MATLLDLAKRVKKGVRLLDRRVPGWRTTLKEHADSFNIKQGSCCVLGTLEHYNGRMQVLNARRLKLSAYPDYWRGTKRLNIEDRGKDYGFNADFEDESFGASDAEFAILQDLWRAEFEA